MKKIIDHKTYNTETATKIAEFDNSNMPNWFDSEYWHETLYRTRKGDFFFHNGGGARTSYAVPVPNDDGWVQGSSKIVPTTANEVQSWAVDSVNKSYNSPALHFGVFVGDEDFDSLQAYLLPLLTVDEDEELDGYDTDAINNEMTEMAYDDFMDYLDDEGYEPIPEDKLWDWWLDNFDLGGEAVYDGEYTQKDADENGGLRGLAEYAYANNKDFIDFDYDKAIADLTAKGLIRKVA